MIMDHMKYLKTIIETMIVGRNGTGTPLSGKFLEVYPKPAEIKRSCPCACLGHRPGKTHENGSFIGRNLSEVDNEIVLTRRLYDADGVYQIDFYSTDIYDLIERDNSYHGFLKQFMSLIAENSIFAAASDARAIQVKLGPFGLIDTNIVVDDVYKAFCQVVFKDGVDKDTAVPRITGATINDGGVS